LITNNSQLQLPVSYLDLPGQPLHKLAKLKAPANGSPAVDARADPALDESLASALHLSQTRCTRQRISAARGSASQKGASLSAAMVGL